MNANFILFILTIVAQITGFVVTILTYLMIFVIKQTFFFLVGCGKVFFASTNTKITAIVLICVSIIDVTVVYRFTNQYRYSQCIHLLIISSPFFYLASVGKRPGQTERGVYVDD